MLSPRAAAEWLSQRLGRTVSYETVLLYVKAGDLAATNVAPGAKRARWIIIESDLEALAIRVGPDGQMPMPTGGWPKYQYPEGKKRNRKKADALTA